MAVRVQGVAGDHVFDTWLGCCQGHAHGYDAATGTCARCGHRCGPVRWEPGVIERSDGTLEIHQAGEVVARIRRGAWRRWRYVRGRPDDPGRPSPWEPLVILDRPAARQRGGGPEAGERSAGTSSG